MGAEWLPPELLWALMRLAEIQVQEILVYLKGGQPTLYYEILRGGWSLWSSQNF